MSSEEGKKLIKISPITHYGHTRSILLNLQMIRDRQHIETALLLPSQAFSFIIVTYMFAANNSVCKFQKIHLFAVATFPQLLIPLLLFRILFVRGGNRPK